MSEKSPAWSFFAWIVFLTAGIWNLMIGAMMLVRKEYFPSAGLIYESIQSHGWILIVVAVLQIAVALAIAAKQDWARWLGILLAILGTVVWFYYALYLPWLGLMAVIAYVLVIFSLTARWEE